MSVPALALVLVFLINMLGGISARIAADYEYILDNHPIHFELSNGDGTATDGLIITERYLSQLTEPDYLWSLSDYVKDILFKRELHIVGEQEPPVFVDLVGISDVFAVVYFGDDGYLINEIINPNISGRYEDIDWEQPGMLDPDVYIDVFHGYSKDLHEFLSFYGAACIVTEDILKYVNNGVLKLNFMMMEGSRERIYTYNLDIAGVIRGPVSGKVFCHELVYSQFSNPTQIPGKGGIAHFIIVDPHGDRVSICQPVEMFITLDAPVHGSLVGITMPEEHEAYLPASLVNAGFIDGYDRTVFLTNEQVCVVADGAMQWVRDGVVYLSALSKADDKAKIVDVELKVIGTAPEDGSNTVFVPFLTANEIGLLSDGQQFYADRLRATISDNRSLADFKHTAQRTFHNVGIFFNPRESSMTIFDAEFYDLTETLQQMIFFVDIVTPFVYIIAVCVGFVASFLLTRRRTSEFAIMRSIGVNKESIFVVTLFEQALLCAAGAFIGCVIFTLTWDMVFISRSAVFLACYVLGAVLSSAKAAGTDVLRLLRDKE